MTGRYSDLAVLTGANLATDDFLAVVDKSDTSMAATGTNKEITVSEFGIGLGVASLNTLVALLSAKQDALYAAENGYFAMSGCALSVSGTAGEIQNAAGRLFIGTTEKNVAANTAISTTVTTLASGLTSGQAVWVKCEYDASGVIQFNSGTAAAAADATIPTTTAGRVLAGLMYVPFGATTVSLSTSGATDAKLFVEPLVTRAIHSARQLANIQAAQTAVTNPTASLTSLLNSAFSAPADSLAVGDIIEVTAGGTMLIHTTSTVALSIFVGGVAQTTITTSSLTADTANSRNWQVVGRGVVTAIGASAHCNWDFKAYVTAAAATAAKLGTEFDTTTPASATAFDSTAACPIDVRAKNTTGDAATTFTCNEYSVTKIPA